MRLKLCVLLMTLSPLAFPQAGQIPQGGGVCTLTNGPTSGFVLTAGAGTNCAWQAAGSATVDNNALKNSDYIQDTSASANTITGTTGTTFPAAYAAGQQLHIRIANTNTGATTINVNALGAKNVTKNGAAALTGGEMTANQGYLLLYDGTQWQLLNPNPGNTLTVQTNGTNNTSQTTLNFQNPSAFNGLTFTFSNPSAGNETFAVGGTLGNGGLTNSAITVNGITCTLGTSCFPYGGVNTYTSAHTVGTTDIGKLIVMNCTSACALTLSASPTATDWYGVESIGSTLATVSLNGKNFNGATAIPALISFMTMNVSSDGTNYFGSGPLVAGTNTSFTPASNGVTIATTSGITLSSPNGTLTLNAACGSGGACTADTTALVSSPAFSATITCNFAASSGYTCAPAALTGNTTLAVSNMVTGRTYILVWTQDATGSRTVTYPGNFSGVCAPWTEANAITQISLNYDGTNVHEIACVTNGTPTFGAGPERSSITSTTSGNGVYTFASGSHTFEYYANASGNRHIAPRCAGSTDQCAASDLSNGVSGSGAVCLASGSACSPGGVNVQTTSYTLGASDYGKLVTENGTSLTATLPASPPSSTWFAYIENLASTSLTVSRNGLNINGGTTNITLLQYQWTLCYTDGSNYFCTTPVVAGTNITLTPASNGLTITSSGGGSGCTASGAAGVVQGSNGAGACQATSIIDNGSKITQVDLITTVGLGVPVLGWQSVLANSSATALVTLATTPTAGEYRISYVLDMHTACTTGTGAMSLSFGWTGNAARTLQTGTMSLPSAQASGSYISGVFPIYVASGNVTFTPTLNTACTTGTATWDGDIWMERVN